jgi:hypothetical protein
VVLTASIIRAMSQVRAKKWNKYDVGQGRSLAGQVGGNGVRTDRAREAVGEGGAAWPKGRGEEIEP